MEVIRAKSAGFCFGVKRAMDKVEEQINNNGNNKIYTYGPIIHNEEVVKNLEVRGVHTLRDDGEVDAIYPSENDVIIIRSHGVPESVQIKLEKQGFRIVDATCPFVKRIHNTVREESEKNKIIIIVGNPKHPEVEGIVGWCKSKPYVIENVEEVDSIPFDKEKEYCVVAQTTFNHNKFKDIVEKINSLYYNVNVVNTICNATFDRQKESKDIACMVDTMIVIGDTHSSNSKKLFEICREECADTHFIQTLDDLDLSSIESVQLVGITAGASTPNYIIEEVQKRCQS